ncbi:unnamed protein product [Closterium sp. Naga37s-1]|nr:unnamed protein product [Closterium sp. Naga37s-1]
MPACLQVGMIAINDGVLLNSHIFLILRRHFSFHPAYTRLLDLFNEMLVLITTPSIYLFCSSPLPPPSLPLASSARDLYMGNEPSRVTYQTACGQMLDLITTPSICLFPSYPFLSPLPPPIFLLCSYLKIVQYKTAYYSFYLPIVQYETAYYSFYLPVSVFLSPSLLSVLTASLSAKATRPVATPQPCDPALAPSPPPTAPLQVATALILAGVEDAALAAQAREILVVMGTYCQMQDDVLDCFGDPAVIGKPFLCYASPLTSLLFPPPLGSLSDWHGRITNTKAMLALLYTFESLGYRLFHVETNPLCLICIEVAYIHDSLLQPANPQACPKAPLNDPATPLHE